MRSTNVENFQAFIGSSQRDHEAQENIEDFRGSNEGQLLNKPGLTSVTTRSTNVDNFNAFTESNQGDPESQENIEGRRSRSSNTSESSSNAQWSDSDMEGKCHRCAKLVAVAVIMALLEYWIMDYWINFYSSNKIIFDARPED